MPTYNMDFDKGGVKFDDGKPRLELLPVHALEQVALVLAAGGRKYGDTNWRNGMPYGRVLGAGLRHVFAFMRGEDLDDETGLPHLAHAVCCFLFALTYSLTGTGEDDRYVYPSTEGGA